MPAAREDRVEREARKPRKAIVISDEPNEQLDLIDVVTCEELFDLLQRMLDEGHALTIGRTAKGKALALSFLMGGSPIKRYTANRAEWLALLAQLE